MKVIGIRKIPFIKYGYLYQKIKKMQITEERKKRVIDLYFNQHKSYAEIAQIERISPRDIHTIIKEEETRRQKHKQQELSSKSYQLFSEGKTSIEVAIILNLPASKVSKLYREYWKNQIGIVIAENNTAKAMETRIKSQSKPIIDLPN
ncbi:MAG: hypothetical protein M3227_02790 [Thermoproteota archaeon]|nr:hypothetical protein [Thermoproteota archaeon]